MGVLVLCWIYRFLSVHVYTRMCVRASSSVCVCVCVCIHYYVYMDMYMDMHLWMSARLNAFIHTTNIKQQAREVMKSGGGSA